VHLVNRDYEEMAQDYYRLGFLDRSVDVRPIVPALAAFFDDVLTASVSELNFKTITDGLGAILYAYPFNVPAYYALILRSLTVLEGLALSTDPGFKVLAAAYPFFAARLLADDAPALRDALAELLFKDGQVRWGRLEGLLLEGRKSAGFAASADALPTLLDLILGAEDAPLEAAPTLLAIAVAPSSAKPRASLRMLAEAEAARVAEALLLGGGLERLSALRPFLDSLPPGLAAPPAALRAALLPAREQAELAALREKVLRVAALLQPEPGASAPAAGSGGGVDFAALASVLRQPRCVAFINAVTARVAQRALARTLQGVLALQSGGGGAPPAEAQPAGAVAR
jgi:aarF domain-containing kinase